MPTTKRDNVTRPSSWAMENLVGKANLRLGIPDTILFKDGAPHVWLFTSRTGYVLNKRSLRKSSIKDRFARLFATNPNNPQQRVATVRFMDGTVRNLGREAFKEMMNKFPATEPGIMSIQCYMQGKGASGTVYRNSYRVINDKGLAVTGTNSFTTLDSDPAAAAAPSCTWSEREIKLEKCMALRISKALDEVTLSVVRYLEGEQDRPTRILGLRCDYLVDAASQIWLTWIGDTTVAVADAAQDLRLADVALEGPRGRGEFLGPQNALDMQRNFGGPPGPTRKTRRRGDDKATATVGQETDIGEAVDRAAEVIELPRGVVGTGGSGGIAGALSRAEATKRGVLAGPSAADPSLSSKPESSSSSALAVVRESNGDANGRPTMLSTMTVGVRIGEAWEVKGGGGMLLGEKRFPSSFSCAGDYCTIRVLVRSVNMFVMTKSVAEATIPLLNVTIATILIRPPLVHTIEGEKKLTQSTYVGTRYSDFAEFSHHCRIRGPRELFTINHRGTNF